MGTGIFSSIFWENTGVPRLFCLTHLPTNAGRTRLSLNRSGSWFELAIRDSKPRAPSCGKGKFARAGLGLFVP
jgi:hypothetical protein